MADKQDPDYMGTAQDAPPERGPRRFRPNPIITLIALAMLGALLSLGTWQANRYLEATAQLEEYVERHDRQPPVTSLSGHTGPERIEVLHHRRAEITGHIDASGVQLLTARYKFSQQGYGVLMPLAVEGYAHPKILVDVGWVPVERAQEYLDGLRARDGQEMTVKGRLQKPLVAIEKLVPVGEAHGLPTWRHASPEAIRERVEGLDPDLYLQAGEQAEGKHVDLEKLPIDGYRWPLRMQPSKHVEYSVTWYGVAVALIGVWIALSFRREEELEAEPEPPKRL